MRQVACPGRPSPVHAEGHPGPSPSGALVGFAQTKAAQDQTTLKPGVPLRSPTKFVLVSLAIHACQDCGLARPGVALLMMETQLSERAVRQALKLIRGHTDEHGEHDWVKIHAYPHGGSGVTTEYVVFPRLAKLSTDECGRCASVAKRVHVAQG